MSYPIFWPIERYFEPIGNTPAVSLTRDIPPEVDAHILLLDCKDCSNVLFTVFCERPNSQRKLDFTCCDLEPAIVARAVILLTMAIDGTPCDSIWNIFYHTFLDQESVTTLVTHCRKLALLTETLDDWNKSVYGAVVRFGSSFTFSEVHHLLSLYASSDQITAPTPVDNSMTKYVRDNLGEKMLEFYNHSSARSAGPLHKYAERVYQEHFDLYRTTGTTFSEEHIRRFAVHRNPTFYYSRHGPDTVIHICTDPLAPFHTAPLFGKALDRDRISVADLVGAARREFNVWCRAYRTATMKSVVVARFLVGDPLVVARTFECFGRQKMRTSSLFIAPWSTRVFELSSHEYERNHAPYTFNVIDSSTLSDTLGMYNILSCVIPILSRSPQTHGVLYTESLVRWYDDPKTGLPGSRMERFADLGLWLDLCPVDFVSGFTTRFSEKEPFPNEEPETGINFTRRHDVLVWKRPCSGDIIAANHPPPELSFQDPGQLALLLHEAYRALFGDAEWTRCLIANIDAVYRGFEHRKYYHYTRESFVCLLKCVRERYCLGACEWDEVMDRFLVLNRRKAEQPMESHERLCDGEFCTQLFRHGLYTSPGMDRPAQPVAGRLSLWSDVSPLLRVYLVVPRAQLASGPHSLTETALRYGTSGLTVSLEGSQVRGLYQCLHPVYGSVTNTGTDAAPDVQVQEDPLGHRGRSDLVIWFIVDTASLWKTGATAEEMVVEIELFVFTSLDESPLTFGNSPIHRFTIFQTTLEDRSSVFLAPEPLLPSVDYDTDPRTWPCPRVGLSPSLPMPIGDQRAVHVFSTEDEVYGHHLKRYQVNLAVHDSGIAALLRTHGTRMLTIELNSSCTARLTITDPHLVQDIVFPLPFISSAKLGFHVRTTNSDEVNVEVTLEATGNFLEVEASQRNATPVIPRGDIICPSNIHFLNLDRMPVVDLRAPIIGEWFVGHLRSQMSVLESNAQFRGVQHTSSGRMFWRLPKESITHAFLSFIPSVALNTNKFGKSFRVVRLRETSALDHPLGCSDTILFLSGLRYDLTAHTVVADTYVLTIAPPLTQSILEPLVQKDAIKDILLFGEELRMWKQLLPACAERCRSWSHGANCEYKASGRIPLETRLHGGDPLCSCGRGKDVEGLCRVKSWAPFAPYATRIALSPLFPVWYLEPQMMLLLRRVGSMKSDWTLRPMPLQVPRCLMCQKMLCILKKCARCRKVTYCSEKCQREDWPRHKSSCKGLIKQ